MIDPSLDKTDDMLNTDSGRKYELEVLECNGHPKYFMPENLLGDKCFYIRPTGHEGMGSNLAIQVDAVDLYYPEDYGIYNL
jgi:hypothetical protein